MYRYKKNQRIKKFIYSKVKIELLVHNDESINNEGVQNNTTQNKKNIPSLSKKCGSNMQTTKPVKLAICCV